MKNKYMLLYFALMSLALQTIGQPSSFAPRGAGGGGALYTPRINPANDSEFYIPCDMSDMFHTTDFGKSFSIVSFTKLPVFSVSTYEFTSNPNIAYSDYSDGNSGWGVRTTDGGATWVGMHGFDTSDAPLFAMKSNYHKPNQIILDYYDKITISNDTGNTFTTVATEISSGVGLLMGGVFISPTGDSIYIGTNQGIYYSTDGGSTFKTMTTSGIPGTESIFQFAGAENGGTMRFTCISGLNGNVYNGLTPGDYYGLVANVYTMDNASGTWVTKTGTIDITNDFVEYLTMAENDINTIYLGGGDNATGGPLVYKSTDGALTWNKVYLTSNNQNIITGWEGDGGDKNWGWDQNVYGIQAAPNNSNIVVFGNEGDAQVTSDGGTTWRQAYVNVADEHPADALTPTQKYYHSIGLENTSCWQVYWQSASEMIAGYSDICGLRSLDSGKSWGFSYNGLGGVNSIYRVAATPSGSILFAATSNTHDIYQSTHLTDGSLDGSDSYGNVMYSNDNGANWSVLHAFGHHVFWIAIDPNDSNKMYASVIDYAGGTGGIWMTGNLNNLGGTTWTQLSAPPRTEGHPASIVVLNDGKVLCSYSGRRGTSGFTASSGVFLYDPGTTSWSDVSDANMDYWTMDVMVDPGDAAQNTWYAGVFTHWGSSASGQGGLYKTTNRGGTWTKLTGSQFDRVGSVTFNPKNHNQAYLTTETQGLNVSNNMNTATPTWSLVPAYLFSHPDRVFFNPYNEDEMWVTSFGNAMAVANLATTGVPEFTNAFSELKAYPNPTKHILNVILPKQMSADNTLEVYDVTGRLIKKIVAGNSSILEIDTYTWDAGAYILFYGNNSVKVIKE